MTTKFSFEVPLAHLNDFDKDQDYLFTLSFLYADARYCNYLDNKLNGRYLILDNSYNETNQPGDVKQLKEIAEDFNPDIIICPDCNGWGWNDLSNAYWIMRQEFLKHQLWMVAKSTLECNKMYYLNRNYATTYEQRLGIDDIWNYKAKHFLGLINPWECFKFHPHTCDTGMPIKLALKGKTIKDWYKDGCRHPKTTPDYFKIKMTLNQIKLAKENIKIIKECANGTYNLQAN
jgi:hypothetical protein